MSPPCQFIWDNIFVLSFLINILIEKAGKSSTLEYDLIPSDPSIWPIVLGMARYEIDIWPYPGNLARY